MKKYYVLVVFLVGCQQQQPINTHSDIESCTAATVSGGVEITCPDGSNGFVSNGAAGPSGPQGSPGPTGAPGTSVTVVQFCNKCTPIYPSDFPEIGLCLGGNLYAVYSENDGFLTLVTPGNYYSNGINCSCNFTVKSNCEVIHD